MTPTADDLRTLLSRVATGLARLRGIADTAPLLDGGYRLQFEEWDWEIGVGLYGLFRHAEATGDRALMSALGDWYDWQIGRGLPPRQVNSTAPMLALAGLLDHVARPEWEALARDWADWLMTGLARTEERGFQHVVKERANDGELWDDTLFMTCLFLARAGRRFDRPDWTSEALYQFLVHIRFLADPVSGLWFHGWTFHGRHNFARALWGRGNSWATIAIPEIVRLVPDMGTEIRTHLGAVLDAQVAALGRLQRPDGFFHTLLDDRGSPIEASATAGFAYGIRQGIDLGLLPGERGAIADRAFAAVLSVIGEDGIVGHVSDGTAMGHDLDHYRRIPDIAAPYGQALVMLMLVDALARA